MRLAPSRPPARFARRLAAIVAALLLTAAPAMAVFKPIPLDWTHTVGDPSVVKTATDYVVVSTGAKVNRALSKNGRVWRWRSSALGALPSWAKPSGGDVWAADMEKVGSKYVLYFAAPVKGRTGTSRCIGAATAASATGTFMPVPGPPLVCPSWFTAVPAQDRVIDKAVLDAYPSASAAAQQQRRLARAQCASASASAVAAASSNAAAASAWATAHPSTTPTPSATASPTGTASVLPTASATGSPTGLPTEPSTSTDPLPSDTPTFGPTVPVIPPCTLPPLAPKPATASQVIGAIDPSFFLDSDGSPYLLYKTDGRPSSIRLLALSADGLHPATGAYSQQLVANAGVLENPVMLHRGGLYYLFDSYGDYARCSYATVWQASTSLLSWRPSAPHVLLNRRTTHGLCGPGGADILAQPTGPLMYFEAWTCKRSWKPCNRNFWSYGSPWLRQHPVRALYAVKLGFHGTTPYVKRYLKGSKRRR